MTVTAPHDAARPGTVECEINLAAPHTALAPRALVVILLCVLSLGLVLRLWGLTREPIWLDEAFSWRYSSGSTAEIFAANARDIHPPGYYLMLRAWRAPFGDSAAALRSYSLLWSLVGVALVVLLAAEVSASRAVAAAAGLLMAVNPLDVYYAQEARMYSQVAALGVAATLLLWRWMRAVEAGGPRRRRLLWLLGYAVAATCMMYTHYLAAFIMAAHGLWVAWWALRWRRVGALADFAGAALISGALFSPWLLFVRRIGAGLYSKQILGWIPRPRAGDLVVFLWHDFVSAPVAPPRARAAVTAIGIGVVALAAAVLAVAAARRSSMRAPVLFLSWMLLGPPALALLASLVLEPVYFRPRFTIMVLPYFALLAALAATALRRRTVGFGMVGLAVAAMSYATAEQYSSIIKVGMSGFAELYRQSDPPDLVAFFPHRLETLASYYVGHQLLDASPGRVKRVLRRAGRGTLWVAVSPRSATKRTARERERLEWLQSLGPSRQIAEVDHVRVWEITLVDHSPPSDP